MFGDNIKTKIKILGLEKSKFKKFALFAVILSEIIVWIFFSILFYLPKKVVNYVKARRYAAQMMDYQKNRTFSIIAPALFNLTPTLSLDRRGGDIGRWQRFVNSVKNELIEISHFHITQKSGKKWAFDIAIVALIFIVIFQLSNFSQAATYYITWTSTAHFDSNVNGEGATTKTSNITTASNEVKLVQQAATKTENSYSDFSLGTTSSTILDGNALKTAPTALADTWSNPGTIGSGGSMIRNGSDDNGYVLAGSTTNFYKYSFSANSWVTLASTPASIGAGSKMLRNGSDDYIYVTQGYGASPYTGFYRYSISGNSWTTLTVVPGAIKTAGQMIRNGSDNDIYVLQGGGNTGFYRYSISGNSWTTLAAALGSGYPGNKVLRNGSDDYIYIGGAGFYRYSISGNSWTTLTAPPNTLQTNGVALRNGADDYIYVQQGNGNTGFYRYSISSNAWTTLTAIPAGLGNGGRMIRNGSDNDIYALQGNAATGFYKYSISGNSWTTLTVVPGAVSDGNMLRNGSNDEIYVLQGGGTGFYKYSVVGTTWTTLGLNNVPGTISTGTTATLVGTDIYVTRGGGTAFYKYSTSSLSWTTLTNPTGNPTWGAGTTATLVGTDIYVTKGGVSTEFYKYSTSTPGWTTLAGEPNGNDWGAGTTSVLNGTDIFYVTQDGNVGFYKYSTTIPGWTILTAPVSNPPWGVGTTATLVGTNIYITFGSRTTFYKYSISSPGWTTLTNPSATWAAGTTATVVGTDIYVTLGGGTAFYKYSINSTYASSGTFASQAMDLGTGATFGTLSYSATTPGNSSVAVKVRTGNQSNMSDATAWGSCGSIANGASLTSGSPNCVTNGQRYVQYQATLNATSDLTQTPTLSSVSINYSQYTHDSGETFEAKFNNSANADYAAGSRYPLANEKTSYDKTINLLANASIEDGIANKWTKGPNAATATEKANLITENTDMNYVYEGTKSVKIDVYPVGHPEINPNYTSAATKLSLANPSPYTKVYPNTYYTLSAYAKGGPLSMTFYERNGTGATGSCVSGSNCVKVSNSLYYANTPASHDGWTRTVMTVKTSSDCTLAGIYVVQDKGFFTDLQTASDPVYIDAIQLEQNATASAFLSDAAGMHIDAGTANLAKNTGFEYGIANVYPWASTGSTDTSKVTLDSGEYYDGQYSVKISSTSGQTNLLTTTPVSTNAVAVSPSTQYTFSVFSKGGSGTMLAQAYKADGSTTTGTDNATSVPVFSRWTRTTKTFTTPADAAFVKLTLQQAYYSGEAAIYFDAVQLEANSFDTPYKGEGADVLKYSAASNMAQSAGTVEFWFKPDWAGNDGATHYLFDSNPQDGTNKDKFAIYKDSSNALFFDIYDHGGTNYKRASIAADATNLSSGVWHHLAATYSSNQPVAIFLDGTKSTNALAGNGTGTTAVPYTFLIGSHWNNSTFVYDSQANSTTDNFIIYNRVLSDSEVSAHASALVENSNPGIISNLKVHEPSDANAIWGSVKWAETVPNGTNVKFRTRSAATEGGLATAVWSAYIDGGGDGSTYENIDKNNPAANTGDAPWIELEMSLSTSDGTATPTLSDFTLQYQVNAPPVITVNSAAQSQDEASFGKVIVNYDISDLDNTSEQVYLFYEPQAVTLTGGILSIDAPPWDTAVTASSIADYPDSGTLSIGNETFTYTSKNNTNKTFHITARHTTQHEISQVHSPGDEVFVQATGTITDDIGSITPLGAGKSITWNALSEVGTGKSWGSAKIRVVADDNQTVYSTGVGYQAIIIDTASPTATSLKIANDDAYTNTSAVTLNLAATDNSAIKVKISNNADLSVDSDNPTTSGIWLDYATTKSWNLIPGDGLKTVYFQFMDIYGNTVSASNDTIIKASPPAPTIVSATQGADGKITITYNVSDSVDPPTGQTKFNEYLRYAPDGTNFELIDAQYLFDDQNNSPGTGNPFQIDSTGNGKIIVWDPTIQFSGLYKTSGQHKLRILVDDQNTGVTIADPTDPDINDPDVVERIGYDDHTAFQLDTSQPSGTYISINNDDVYVHGYQVGLKLDAVDDSGIKVKISNNANLSYDNLNNDILGDNSNYRSGDWINYSLIPISDGFHRLSNWNLPATGDGEKTVYYQFKDEYGNTVALNNDTIVKSSPPAVTINSVTEQSDGSVQIKYALTDAIYPPTGQTYFDIYATYSPNADGSSPTQIGSIDPTAISGNTTVNTADGTEQTITWYPTKEDFSNNLYKTSGQQKLVLYADDLNSGVTEGGSERLASDDEVNFTLDTVAPVKNYFYTDSDDDSADNDYTQSSTIKLIIDAADDSPLYYRVANTQEELANASWTAMDSSPKTISDYVLISGEGIRTVYGELKDGYDNVTSFSKDIYKVSTPTVTVNSVAQSVTPETYGKVYIDYNIQDALYDSLDVTMKYCTGSCDDIGNWHAVTDVTNIGAQAITPGESRNIVSEWDAQTQLDEIEFADVRFRVYASNGVVVPDETMYNPYDEIGADPNAPETFILDVKNPQGPNYPANNDGAINITGTTEDGKIGQPQLDAGISLDLSVTDISALYVQFSNDGINYGTSTNSGGSLKSASSTIETDDFSSCNFALPNTGCSWVTYANGDGMSWDPITSEQEEVTVYMRVRDTYGNIATFTDTATVDTISPTPPRFIVTDSSYAAYEDTPGRYMVTISWDLFRQCEPNKKFNADTQACDDLSQDDPEYVSPESEDYATQLASYNNYLDITDSGNAYTLMRKASKSNGEIETEASHSVVAWPKSTIYGDEVSEYVDRLNSYTFSLDDPETYSYCIYTTDAVGNTSSCEWQDIIPEGLNAAAPDITGGPTAAETTDTTATITWITDRVSNSFVLYATEAEFEENPGVFPHEAGNSLNVTSHSVLLENLEPATKYYYRVKSVSPFNGKEAYGKADANDPNPYNFNTDSAPRPVITGVPTAAETTDTTATITWITDRVSNSFVLYATKAEFDEDPGVFPHQTGNSENVTEHEVVLEGLTPATKYYFRVKSVFQSNGEAAYSKADANDPDPYEFNTDSSPIPGAPEISSPTAETTDVKADSVIIRFNTNREAYSQIFYSTAEKDLTDKASLNDDSLVTHTDLSGANTNHVYFISKLEQATKYYFRVRIVDKYATEVYSDTQYFTTTTECDPTIDATCEAAISAVIVSDITMTSAVVSWTSVSITQYEVAYGKSASYGDSITDKSSSSATIHTVKLNNLTQGTTYHFRIKGTDENATEHYSDDYVFSTITLPQIKNVSFADITETGLTVNWGTNVATDSQVEYKINATDTPRVEAVTDSATTHSVKLQNLDSNTTYTIRAIVRDIYGNQAISNATTVKTKLDETPPKITQVKAETSASLSQDGTVQAIISWQTDEAASTQVIYSLGSQGNYDKQSQKDENLATSHLVIVPNMAGSSTYHYKVVSIDKAGNKAESNDYTILTPRKKKSLLDIIVNNMEQEFGWLRKLGIMQ